MGQQITFRQSTGPDNAVVLAVSGEIDLLTAEEFGQQLAAALRGAHTLVVLDLSRVRYLASAGLYALLASQESARSLGIVLRIVATGRAVLRPIEITGLRSDLTLFDSVDAACSGAIPIADASPTGLIR